MTREELERARDTIKSAVEEAIPLIESGDADTSLGAKIVLNGVYAELQYISDVLGGIYNQEIVDKQNTERARRAREYSGKGSD